jgi:hypothetical protein
VDWRPPWDVGPPPGGSRSTLFLPCPFPVLAQADLEEYQQHGPTEPKGDQGDCEHLAGEAADQGGAQRTGEDEQGG